MVDDSVRKMGMVSALFAIFFCGCILLWEIQDRSNNENRLQEHARVIENAIWNLDTERPQAYLKLVAARDNYERIRVLAVKEAKPLIDIQGLERSVVDRLLMRIGLIYRIPFSIPIYHNDTKIGRLDAVHIHNTIYTYFYLLLVLCPLWLAIKFFLQTIRERNMLASLVAEKTKELRRSEDNLRTTLNSIGDAVIATDTDGRITLMNPVAERLTGWRMKEVNEHPLAGVLKTINSRTGEPSENPVEKALESGRIVGLTDHTVLIARDGARYQIADSAAPIRTERGTVIGVVIVFRDVTEQVRIEEMMVQSEKMLSVGGLAAGMAHEINNPLAGMMQTASVMNERLTNPAMPANLKAAEKAGASMEAIGAYMEARGIIRMLGRIRESGSRAAEIVANMLSFSRKSEAAFSTHDLAELIDQTVDLAGSDYDLKKEFDFRQIEIVREYEDSAPPVVCEAGKIRQVLLNILRNGAEAMQESQVAETPRFTLRLVYEPDVGIVRIEIEDNGPGMDESTRKRVFEPFYTTKPTDRGTGLGLSVSYFIITENHGGDMRVASEPGKGATFTIQLPTERNT